MKKIFAIALAVVMVLSIASVAGALWEPAAATTNDNFGIKVDVEKYALNTGVYSWSYVEDANITAANGADVYYVVKVTYTKDVKAADDYKVTVTYNGIDGEDFTFTGVEGTKGQTKYYNGKGKWIEPDKDTDIDQIVIRARCFDTSSAAITVEASCERDLTEPFPWKGYQIQLVEEYLGGNDILNIFKGDDYIQFEIADDGQASKYGDSGANSTLESDLFKALGFTADQLNAGEVYMTDANLRAAFGFSYKVTDSVDWTATNHPIIVDPIVGIPKTGDNASVIGFAMIMVAVVAAAVAVRKVNA